MVNFRRKNFEENGSHTVFFKKEVIVFNNADLFGFDEDKESALVKQLREDLILQEVSEEELNAESVSVEGADSKTINLSTISTPTAPNRRLGRSLNK